MSSPVRYFIRKLGANFVDFSLDYPSNGFTLNGSNVVFLGSTGVDRVYLQKGIQFNFSNSGAGTDEVYLDGSFADFTLSAKGSSTLVLSSAARANTQITLAQEDKVFFSNGSIAVADLLSYAIARNANLATPSDPNTPAPALPALNAAENSLSLPRTTNADGSSRLDSIVRAYTKDINGSVFAQPYAGVKFIVSGHNGVDKVYVAKGGEVNANNLGGGVDLIYLTGRKNEYSATASGSSVLVLTKGSEKVTLASEDKVIFADGSTLVSNAISAAASPASWIALSLDGTGPARSASFASVLGNLLTLHYDSLLDANNKPTSGLFQVASTPSGGTPSVVAVTAVSVKERSLELTLASSIPSGAVVTVSFVDPSSGNDANTIQDLAGNDASSFANQPVVNTAPAAPAISSLVFGDTEGDAHTGNAGAQVSAVVTFNEQVTVSGTVSFNFRIGSSGSLFSATATAMAGAAASKTIRLNASNLPSSATANDNGNIQLIGISLGAGASINGLASGTSYTGSTLSSNPIIDNSYRVDNLPPAAPTLALGSGVSGIANLAEAMASSGVLTASAESGARVLVTFTDTALAANSIVKTVLTNGAAAVPVLLTANDLVVLAKSTLTWSYALSDSLVFNFSAAFNQGPDNPSVTTEPVSGGIALSKTESVWTCSGGVEGLIAYAKSHFSGDESTVFTALGKLASSPQDFSISASAIDAAGNRSSAATASFSLDPSVARPSISLAAGVSGGATAAEATASSGVLSVTAESGSSVTLTFSDSATPSAHHRVRSLTGSGSAQTITLAASELGTDASQLQNGSISVTATSTDAAGNVSIASSSFTLDTVAPTLTAPNADTPAISVVGRSLTLNFDGALDSDSTTKPTPNAFSVQYLAPVGNSVLVGVSSFAISGSQVLLTLAAPVPNGVYAVVSYTDPNPIDSKVFRDVAGNVLANFVALPVTVNTPPAVTVSSVVFTDAVGDTRVGKAGTVLSLAITFSEPVTVAGAPVFNFRIGSSGSTFTATAAANASASATLTLTATLPLAATAADNGTIVLTGVTLGAGASITGSNSSSTLDASYLSSHPLTDSSYSVDNIPPANPPTLALGNGVSAGATLAEATASSGVLTVTAESGSTVLLTFTDRADATHTLVKTVLGNAATAVPVVLTAADLPTLGIGNASTDQVNYSVSASSSDAAGNRSSSATASFSIDSFTPTPSFTLGAGVSDGASLAEATASTGVLRMDAESASTVLVTFTDSATPIAHSLIKTIIGSSTASAIRLVASELGQAASRLQDGSISVTAIATDQAGNVSGQGSSSFVLDSTAPALTAQADGRAALSVLNNKLTLNLSEPLDPTTVPPNNAFVVTYTALGFSAQRDYVFSTVVSGQQLVLTLQYNIPYAAVVTLSYTDASSADDSSNVVQDLAGNDLASFVQTVANLTPLRPTLLGVAFSDAVGDPHYGKSGDTLTATLSFSEAVNFSGPVTLAFRVVDGPAFSVNYTPPSTSDYYTTIDLTLTLPDALSGVSSANIQLTGISFAAPTHIRGINSFQMFLSSDISSPFTDSSYLVDSRAPAAPTIILGAGIGDGTTRAEATATTGVLAVNAESGSSLLLTLTDSLGHSMSRTLSANGSAQAVTLTTSDLGEGAAQLSDGSIRVTATATDLAGNASSSSSSIFVLDANPPAAPLLGLGSGIGNGATLAEAMASSGLVLVRAEAGSTLRLTFTDSALPSAHSIIKTVNALGLAQALPVSLTADDLGAGVQGIGAVQLVDGIIRITATATDAVGNVSASGSSSLVLDSLAPQLLAAQVVGDQLRLRYDSALDSMAAHLPPTAAFAVTVNGTANPVTQVASADNHSLLLTLATPVPPNATVTLGYSTPALAAASGPLQDLAGNAAANVSNFGVSDNTPYRPVITSVALSDSDSGAAGYVGKQGAGNLSASVTFNEAVNVSGTVTLIFGNPNGGGSFSGTLSADANANSFSRSKTVTFTGATLPAGNFAVYLNSLTLGSGASISAQSLANGGSAGVLDAGNFSVGPVPVGYVVDNTPPVVIPNAGRLFAVNSNRVEIDPALRDTLRAGDKLVVEIPLSEALQTDAYGAPIVTGSPDVAFTIGSTLKNMRYASSFPGTSATRIYATYTILLSDADADGIAIFGGNVSNTVSMTDLAGNVQTLFSPPLTATGNIPWLKVDNAAPDLVLVNPLAPGNGRNAYRAGEKLLIAATFSEKVIITGTPYFTVSVGSASVNAIYDSSNPQNTDTVKYFSYSVVAGDNDSDGLLIGLAIYGGSISDGVGNVANFSSSAVLIPTDFGVDTSTPAAPTLALGNGVSNGANLAEALAGSGVITVRGEAGSNVLITFSDSASHLVIKTVLGTGAAQAVTLTAIDLGGAPNQLQDGSINVSALVQDGAGNTSPVVSSSFSLAAQVPSLALSLGNGVADGATLAEATASSGVLLVRSESGNSITLTFSDSASPAHSVVRNLTGNGNYQAVTLAASDLGSGSAQLGEGIISVNASSSNANGNGSTSTNTQFVLDTVRPVAMGVAKTGLALLASNNQFAQLPDAAVAVSGDITLEAWVYANGTPTQWARIFDLGLGQANNNLILGFDGGKLSFVSYVGANSVGQTTVSSSFVPHLWTHVAVTVGSIVAPASTAPVNLYVNGMQVASGTVTADIAAATRNHSYIGHSNWADADFNGAIRDARIYDNARTAAQIAADMNSTADASDSNLKGYYPLDSSATVSGKSGGGALTLFGNPLLGNPAISFSADTGTVGDFITITHAQTITAHLQSSLAFTDVLWGSLDDGNTWMDLTAKVSGTTLSWTGANLLVGSHTLKLQAKDPAGNAGPVFVQPYVTGELAPTLSLDAALADGANRAEATASTGVMTVHAASGSSVVLTFTDALNHTLRKTLAATGTAQPVLLGDSDIGSGLGQLYNGLISITAQSTTVGFPPSEVSSSSFKLYADMLALGSGVADGADAHEVLQGSGVVTLFSASGARVLLTFSDSATPTAHSVLKTLTGSGSTQAITLTAADLGTGVSKLLDGTISVNAVAYDAANTPNNSGNIRFELDTRPPTPTFSAGARINPLTQDTVNLPWTGISFVQVVRHDINSYSATYYPSGNVITSRGTYSQLAASLTSALGSSWSTTPLPASGQTYEAIVQALHLPGTPPSITGESGTQVTITFTDGSSHLVIKTVTALGAGTAVPVGLDSSDLGNGNSQLQQGAIQVSVTATNALGAVSSPGSGSFVLDTLPPSSTSISAIGLSTDSGTAGDFLTKTAAQTITATLSAPLALGETLWLSMDDRVSWINVSSSVSNTSLSYANATLLPGTHKLEFVLKDAASNPGPITTQQYTLDTTPPSSQVIGNRGLKLVSSNVASNRQYATLPYQATALSGDLALGAWVYADGTPGQWASILDLNDGPGLTNNVILGFADGKLAFRAYSGGTKIAEVISNASFPINSWHYVTVLVGNPSIFLFVDNILDSSIGSTSQAIPAVSRSSSFVGHSNDSTAPDFNGIIREVRIYDTIIGTTQIRNDMNGAVFSNLLISYYPFSTSTASGKSGVPAATLTGSPAFSNPLLSFSADTGTAGDYVTKTALQTITAKLSAPLAADETLWVSLNEGSNWTNVSSSLSGTTLNLANVTLLPGNHNLQFVVRDTADNPGTVTTQPYTLDTTSPTAYVSPTTGLKLLSASHQFAQLPSAAVAVSGDLTLEAWVFADGTLGQWARIFDFNDATGLSNNVILGFDGGKLAFTSYDHGSVAQPVTVNSNFPINSWHHVAVTVGGAGSDAVTLYIDGTAVKTGSIVNSIAALTRSNSFVGHSNVSADPDFNGTIRDVRIYDDARTPAEISTDMAGTVDTADANLKGYYPFSSSAASGKSGGTAATVTASPVITIPALTLSNDTGTQGDYTTSTRAQTITAKLNGTLAADEKVWGALDGESATPTWIDLSSFTSGNVVTWTGATLGTTGLHTMKFEVRDLAGNTGTLMMQDYRIL